MNAVNIVGIGPIADLAAAGLIALETGGNGRFHAGRDGVLHIFTPLDRKVELIAYAEQTLCYVKSAMGYPALYPLEPVRFEGPAEAVLMDLDGTSVHSEHFWIWVIEQTTARLLGNPKFKLEEADLPHVSGHSVSEHLQYCIRKYAPGKKVEEARPHYFDIVHFEMNEIMHGRGRPNAFTPAPGLKDFLLTLKAHKIKIGLVTSGLYEKAWPEIVSAFRDLGMGDPKDFYDAMVSAGFSIGRGQVGTLGELTPKPHPWLYAETARMGLGIDPARRHRVLGMEDSAAGVVSVRLSGFACLGVAGGNIAASGVGSLVLRDCATLAEALPVILGK
jgi:beta-phosphoglucomutase-like phosphatase (HAD superfamily)